MNKLRVLFTSAIASTVLFSAANANEFSIDINDNDVHVRYEQPVISLQNYTGFAELLYSTEIEDADIDGSIYSAGILLNQVANDLVSFRVGGKATIMTIEDSETEFALPLGGDITYKGETQSNYYRIRGFAYIAPEILSFGDLERYIELGVQAEYPFSDQLSGYIGYRNISTTFDSSAEDADISNGLYLGGIFTF